MTVKIIVAVDKDDAIGWASGNLPWKSSDDLLWFKAHTTGHDVFMGSTTFKSLNMPLGLPNRKNIVLSNTHKEVIEDNVIYTNSLDFIHEHQKSINGRKPPDLWVIGGASIYEQTLKLEIIDEIYLTQVHVNSGADVKLNIGLYNFQNFINEQLKLGIEWQLQSNSYCKACSPNITFLHFKKKQNEPI